MISVTSCSPFEHPKSCLTFTYLYVFVVIFVCLLAVNVYPYGEHQSDQEFGVDDLFGYYGSIMCLEIKVQPYGLRFFGERHYKLHVGVSFVFETFWHRIFHFDLIRPFLFFSYSNFRRALILKVRRCK